MSKPISISVAKNVQPAAGPQASRLAAQAQSSASAVAMAQAGLAAPVAKEAAAAPTADFPVKIIKVKDKLAEQQRDGQDDGEKLGSDDAPLQMIDAAVIAQDAALAQDSSAATAGSASANARAYDSSDDDDAAFPWLAIPAAAAGIAGLAIALGGSKDDDVASAPPPPPPPPPNSAPVFGAAPTVNTNEDTAVNVTLTATDANNDALTYTVQGTPVGGTVTAGSTPGTFVFTPSANFNGAGSFVVQVSDGKGGTATQTVNVTVNAVNDLPTFGAAPTVATDEDASVTGSVTATDVEGPVTYSFGSATNGTVTAGTTPGSFVFTPAPNFNGTASFVATATDAAGATTTQTVNVTVNPVNDAPAFGAAPAVTTAEDAAVTGSVSATDAEGPVTYSFGNATNGTVTAGATPGSFVFTPDANFSGTASFVATATDAAGVTTTQTVNVTVTPVNDTPAFGAAPTVTTAEDAAVTGSVSATDAEGPVTYSFGNATNGTVTAGTTPGSFVFTPNPDFSGTASFVATATDADGVATSQTVNVTVTPVNDPIVFTSGATGTVTENAPTSTVIYDADVTNPEGPVTFSFAAGGDSALLNIDPVTGQVTLRQSADFETRDEYTFTVLASEGGQTTSQQVTVSVTDVVEGPPPPPPATQFSLDRGTASQNGAALVDADGSATGDINFSFTEQVEALTNVRIVNFGANDVINLDSDNYSFSATSDDIILSFTTQDGVINSIVLEDVINEDVTFNGILNTEAEANLVLNQAFGTEGVDYFNTPSEDPLANVNSFSFG